MSAQTTQQTQTRDFGARTGFARMRGWTAPLVVVPSNPQDDDGDGQRRPLLRSHGVEVRGSLPERSEEVLTEEAFALIGELHRRFAGRRHELLAARVERQKRIDGGFTPGFLPQTEQVRRDPSWRVAGPGPGLEDRRVEITGPCEPKMAVNALNSGARVWLADLEDACSPTWKNVVTSQLVLRDAVRGQLTHTAADGRRYEVLPVSTDGTAGEQVMACDTTIVMRPRGWHLAEKHLRIVDPRDPSGQGCPASASLVDWALFATGCARELVASGKGPYAYLPKLQSHLEARLWDEVFTVTEEHLGLAHGTVRATVLVETIHAAFEMEEILYELRDHCAGLNAGRWDYIFSAIKTFRERGPRWLLPDRADVTMTVPPMATYAQLLVQTCHRRGAQAIGGMSAFIPQRSDPAATARALERVRTDKDREAAMGFDGSWVAHPGLVSVAQAAFDAERTRGGEASPPEHLPSESLPSASLPSDPTTAARLLDLTSVSGRITSDGLRTNVSAALRYVAAWLGGAGAVAIDGLMEDAATAEISRAQVWQWIRWGAVTADDGRPVTRERVEEVLDDVVEWLPRREGDHLDEAAAVFREVALAEEFPPFLTTVAYANHLVEPRS
ncbi:malate synthase [Quadrisphaera granulorum]|uniref:Malate synthase n=1 Tax=Quadrisphaera granulorum TaxID=317664 RepID=A0A315ZV53_9ACTN|nr:malate synthase A [Quadrisphaera granulorum]PWJ48830.1 malate synthase [Quadrisphaera granulorum]SZE98312.1 malate synthase [Quadrisphaera granulorum]